jgi:16S rRNA (uracil1498-N3)-methyltransferase
MIEAAKQSRQPWLPEARPVRNLDQLVREFPAYKEVWLLTSQTPDPDRLTLNEEHLPIGSRLLALIGPEGGWTEGESAMLQEAGARKISLGPNVLRIETAAIAVAAMVHRML